MKEGGNEMEQVVMLNSILSGYVVRATRVDDDNVEVVGTVSVVDRVHRYVKFEHIIHGFKFDEWDFEIVEVQLPTGENALVAHKKHPKTAATYLYKTGTWYITTGDMSRRCSYSEVYDAIREDGYEVIYEGIEQ